MSCCILSQGTPVGPSEVTVLETPALGEIRSRYETACLSYILNFLYWVTISNTEPGANSECFPFDRSGRPKRTVPGCSSPISADPGLTP